MSARKTNRSKRTKVHAARGVHKLRGGGARRLELRGLRGSALDLLRDQHGWRKTLTSDLVYRIVQEEVINDHLSFLEKFIKTGELPDDWARDFADVEWFLCDYPLQLANVSLGLMEATRATAYQDRNPKTRPPVILDFNNQIVQGRHRVVGAFLRGEKSILAYIPQRTGATNPLVARYGIGRPVYDTHGRRSLPGAAWSLPKLMRTP